MTANSNKDETLLENLDVSETSEEPSTDELNRREEFKQQDWLRQLRLIT